MKEWFVPYLPEEFKLEDLTEEQLEKLQQAWRACEEQMCEYRTKIVLDRVQNHVLSILQPKIEPYCPTKPKKIKWVNLPTEKKLKLIRIIDIAKKENYDDNGIKKVTIEFLTTGTLPPLIDTKLKAAPLKDAEGKGKSGKPSKKKPAAKKGKEKGKPVAAGRQKTQPMVEIIEEPMEESMDEGFDDTMDDTEY